MTDPNEVRNPRYAGATIGDLVRALVHPRKPKSEKHTKEQGEQSSDSNASRVKFQRRKENDDAS